MDTKDFDWGMFVGWLTAFIGVPISMYITPNTHVLVPLAGGMLTALAVALWHGRKK